MHNEKDDDDELASYNPALSMPANDRLGPTASRRTGCTDSRWTAPSTFMVFSNEEDKEVDAGAESEEVKQILTKYDRGWRRIVRNFSPSWFSVTMGTGISSVLLFAIPFHARWLYWLSIVMFVLNAILFALAFIISLLRYTLYPAIWTAMINDSNNSLFLGTLPMGFSTLIRMWVNVCVPAWGPWAVTFAWVLWMIDTAVSITITISLPFTLMSQSNQMSLSRITAVQLLPISATVVASGTGAAVVEVLPNADNALGTMIVCYAMWGLSVPLAATVIVMYYQRLAVHKLPPREVIVSGFLPLGPLGFGGYTIMYLGKVGLRIFPETGTLHPLAGPVFYILGFFIALVMWGFGLAWLMFALASIYTSRPFPFNMGWWGFTFPLGVFAVSTIQLGEEMPSKAFKVLGTIFGVAVLLLWCVVAAGTTRGAWSGKLFYAPCLKFLKSGESKAEAAAALSDEEQRRESSGSGGGKEEERGRDV